ncbi:amidohydrolase family protein [Frankia sp. AgB1.9]|uniref:amidohydrolase family protein n=1 Tax=unclassified Frankia TaxID=2632575 RepID=UPI0019327790|nr:MULTISPECIES: amidohydrolase family protein [unclassified Frankia]MBL7486833.1 amidohydrolase family protein [Frankia sp. AgW1.1]MBL7549794.1 amidohydrolase family protein [Frankia sp. AgB1.9]MBL7622896.1 amidohydrolase family protein [Frankia sp. AgB1.8]
MTEHEGSQLLIRGVRLVDGPALSHRTSVLVDGARIAAIGPDLSTAGRTVVDGEDGVLLPGLIDAHVHLHGEENLEQLVRAGITTALDMGCWPRELVDELRGRPGLTDIRSAGVPATAPGSAHSHIPGRPDAALVSGPADAETFVRDRLAEGSDYLKLIADVPGLDQPTLDALVSAARRQGQLTVAHAVRLIPYQMALAAGADVITHAPLDAILDEATVAALAARGRVVVPTLTMMDAVATRFFGHGADGADGARGDAAAPAGPGYHNAQRSVGLLHRAGVPILAGTDANATVGVPANISHGPSLHRELELLVRAGLSAAAAISAATSLPARHFGLSDRGAIRPGLRADLVLIGGDPLADITDSRRVERVWCAGLPATTS